MTYRLNTRISFLLALLCVLVVAAVLVALPAWAEDEDDWLMDEEWLDEDWDALSEELMQTFAADDEIYFDPVQLANGGDYGLVLQANGTVWGWGYNHYGQLGDGTTEDSIIPVQAVGIENIVRIATGACSSFAIDKDGNVWSWGRNETAQLGLGHNSAQITPGRVQSISDVADVAVSYANTFFLKSDGTLWGVGSVNYLGISISEPISYEPVLILTDVKQIETGVISSIPFSVALKNDGTVWTWGKNTFGSTGLGNNGNVSEPTKINLLNNIVQVSAGDRHAIALQSNGTVWVWGRSVAGAAGGSSGNIAFTPITIDISNVVQVAAGNSVSHVLKSDGTVWSWGDNFYGQYGNGANHSGFNSRPMQANIENATEIIAGVNATTGASTLYYFKADGTAWSNGGNRHGQLGDLTTGTRISTPILMFAGSTTTPPGPTDPTDPTRIWIELAVGETVDLRATALPSELEITPAIWSSADPEIASVNSNGVVTGVAEGMTFVTVTTTDGQYSASIGILVRGEVENIEGMRLEIKLSVGMKTKLIATNANDEVTTDVIWTSSLPNVASVDADGRIEGISPGVTIITATTLGGDFVDSIYVRVL